MEKIVANGVLIFFLILILILVIILILILARVSYLSSHTMHNHCRNNGLGQHLCIP